MEITTAYENLSLTARNLLRLCGAKKGSRVTVELCEEIAVVRKSYRINTLHCSPSPMQWDSSYQGDDGESNPQTSIGVWREAIAAKYEKMTARSLAHYKLAVGLPADLYAMIEAKRDAAKGFHSEFFKDPANAALALDVVAEVIG